MPRRPAADDTLTAAEVVAAMNAQHRARQRDAGPPPIDKLISDLHYLGVPAPEREVMFHPTRRWRFDAAWPAPAWRVAIEIEGLVYSNQGDNQLRGRHVSVTGFQADLAKYGEAFAAGWSVLRVTSSQARNGMAATWIVAHLKARGLHPREAKGILPIPDGV
jgi:hypothetical protein